MKLGVLRIAQSVGKSGLEKGEIGDHLESCCSSPHINWQAFGNKSEKERQTEKLFNRLGGDLIESGRQGEFKDGSKISNLISLSHTEQIKNKVLVKSQVNKSQVESWYRTVSEELDKKEREKGCPFSGVL